MVIFLFVLFCAKFGNFFVNENVILFLEFSGVCDMLCVDDARQCGMRIRIFLPETKVLSGNHTKHRTVQ